MAFAAILASIGPRADACDGCASHAGHDHSDGSHSHLPDIGSYLTPLARNVTAPAATPSVVQRFVVVGDTQGGSGTNPFMPQLISSINEHNASRIVLAGDLVGTGGSGTWNQWISHASLFNGGLQNIIMTPGNHDQPVGTDALWRSTFDFTPSAQPWLPDSQTINGKTGFDQMDYYVDDGSTRFISVTTDTQAFGASQLANSSLEWMREALADAENNAAIENVFVFTHHPVTLDSTGQGASSNRAGTQRDMWQSLVNDSNKVRALFAGHWHLYQPSTPDPDNPDVWELVSGTGGGGLEGRAVQNQHGFNVIDILSNGVIQSTFYGDEDGATNGWEFNDVMDRFNIADPNPPAAGIVGYYSFNFGNQNLDTAPGPLAKQNHGGLNGNATITAGGINGSALSVDGSGDYADGETFHDYNLAVNGNLTLSIYANYDTLASGGDENTLVSYGAATGHPQTNAEAVNITYSLRIRDDKRLEISWERENGTLITMTSTAAASIDGGQWHHYVASRDIDSNEVRFYVDGTQLGAAVPFTDNMQPTGGGAGYLRVGAAHNGGGGFDGILDELTIYNTTLLPGEIFIGPLAGDINSDTNIDLIDFNILLSNFGEQLDAFGSPATLALGDLDFDGDVDFFDFDAFQSAYLAANPGAAPLAIPEPASLSLIALGGLLLMRRRKGLDTGSFGGEPSSRTACCPDPDQDSALNRSGSYCIKHISGLILTAALLPASGAQAASLLHDYQFSGNLNDANPAGGLPTLIADGGTVGANGYTFAQGQGLSLSNWVPGGTNAQEDFTIEFYARFDIFGNGSYGKLVDFKNKGVDQGFYIRNINGGHRPVFWNVNHNSPPSGAFTQGQFHHVVISRDEPGTDDVRMWLDGVEQWNIGDDTNEHAVFNAAGNIIHFFVDDGSSEHPAGTVDYIRVYDGGASQAEVNAMFAARPEYGDATLRVNKRTGEMAIVSDNPFETVQMRGYQTTSASGAFSTSHWDSLDARGVENGTWFEANPSSTQIAELNLTASTTVATTGELSLGHAYAAGTAGAEDLVFTYLPTGSTQGIALNVEYVTDVLLPGDLNGDQTVGIEDLDIVLANWGAVPIGSLLRGDAVADGMVDAGDLNIVLQNWGNVLAPSPATVPEPAGAAVFALLLSSTCRLRQRHWRTPNLFAQRMVD